MLETAPDAPADLRQQPPSALAGAWNQWVRRRDAEIRKRLEAGDEDSLANLLIYGTSFTSQPRLTPELTSKLQGDIPPGANHDGLVERKLAEILDARAADLAQALSRPGTNERLQVMRRLVARKGYSTSTPAARAAVRAYLKANLDRVQSEFVRYREEMAALSQAPDPGQAFLQRSQIFQGRGISLDASLLPNFALEQALAALRDRGILAPHSLRRVAVIGPGLEFIDKDEGFDFYPQQTIQPMAIVDSLVRLGLADAARIRVTTLDISSRVNRHIASAAQAARSGKGYVVQLPRDPTRGWNSAAVRYWEEFGTAIGASVPPIRPPGELGQIQLRAVRIRPDIVRRITPLDLDVIYQRLDLPPQDKFDLVIATNMFVYYGAFEQSLALLNIAHMLRDGGLLLSNDALPEVPSSGVNEVGNTPVPYSDVNPSFGDRIMWYQLRRR